MFKKTPIDLKLEEEITSLLDLMSKEEDKSTDKYAGMTKQLAALHELSTKSRISNETLVTVGTHIAGLVIILGHERAHVIASKAFGLVKKIF
jgi:hypothetical protein